MAKSPLHYCATDNEVYELLMSGKQRITDSVLHAVARNRGIFYSAQDSREHLISNLAQLTYGFSELQGLLGQRENPARAEKLTSVKLNTALSLDEVRSACAEYGKTAATDEKVVSHQEGANKFVLKVDYSKTRLLQRRKRDAEIEFFVGESGTTIRLPATEKANEIIAKVKDALDASRKTDIPAERIELTDLVSPEARTQFFTSLVAGLSGYNLVNVTNVRVDSSLLPAPPDVTADEEDGDQEVADDENDRNVEETMISAIENVALKGSSLLGTPEYQELRRKGFYTTFIVWRSRQVQAPYDIVEFEAGFDDPRKGTGFKYNVKGVHRYLNGRYTTTLRPLVKDEKATLLALIEQTARRVLAELRATQTARLSDVPEEPA
jgi:hypothetical protein